MSINANKIWNHWLSISLVPVTTSRVIVDGNFSRGIEENVGEVKMFSLTHTLPQVKQRKNFNPSAKAMIDELFMLLVKGLDLKT